MYVFDLEGTLSNHKHRLHLLPSKEVKCANIDAQGKRIKRDLYREFHSHFHRDEVYLDMKVLLTNCIYTAKTIILTGMKEEHRQDAQNWLLINGISYSELVMRPNDSYESSPDFKYNYLKGCGEIIHMVFDDREDVIAKLTGHGIPAILVKK